MGQEPFLDKTYILLPLFATKPGRTGRHIEMYVLLLLLLIFRFVWAEKENKISISCYRTNITSNRKFKIKNSLGYETDNILTAKL